MESIPEVFVSYRREEPDAASRLARELIARGCLVFIDERMLAGDVIDDIVDEALRQAIVGVAVVTPKYAQPNTWSLAEARRMRAYERQGTLAVVPFLYGTHVSDLPYPEWADLVCPSIEDGWEKVVREVSAAVEKQRRMVTQRDLPAIARALAALDSGGAQSALDGIGVPEALPSATPFDQWYLAVTVAQRSHRLRDLLTHVLTRHPGWSPGRTFLSAQTGGLSPVTRALPARDWVEARLQEFRAAAHGEDLTAFLRDDALHTVAPRLAARVGVPVLDGSIRERLFVVERARGWIDAHDAPTDPPVWFALAADALLHAADATTLANTIGSDRTGDELALLATVARWSGDVAHAIDQRGYAGLLDWDALPRERQKQGLAIATICVRVLADAGRSVVTLVDTAVVRAVAADHGVRAVEILQHEIPERLDRYVAMLEHGDEAARRALLSIRRLVECGAAADVLPQRYRLAVCAALTDAADADVAAVANDRAALHLWMSIVGPRLTPGQRALLAECASAPRTSALNERLRADASLQLGNKERPHG